MIIQSVSRKSAAIELSDQLLNDIEKEQLWINTFKERLETYRNLYDVENNQISKSLSESEIVDKTKPWIEKIDSLSEDQKKLNQLISRIKLQMRKLQGCSYTPDEWEKASFLDEEAKKTLDQTYRILRTKVDILEDKISQMESIFKKSDEEIPWITNHPHQRRYTMIQWAKEGRVQADNWSEKIAQISRHVSEYTSYIPGWTSPNTKQESNK